MEKQKRVCWTLASIAALPTKNRRYYVLDSERIGLRIYIDTTGHKTYHLQRYIAGRGNLRNKLGTFPEMTILRARKLAEEYKSLSVLGKDPKLVQEKKQEDSKVFGQVVEEFIERRLTKKDKQTRARVQFMKGWFLGKTRDVNFTKFWGANKDRLSIKDKKINIKSVYCSQVFNCNFDCS